MVPQLAKSGEVEPVEGWAQRLAKAVKEDSVVILLDECAAWPDLLQDGIEQPLIFRKQRKALN